MVALDPQAPQHMAIKTASWLVVPLLAHVLGEGRLHPRFPAQASPFSEWLARLQPLRNLYTWAVIRDPVRTSYVPADTQTQILSLIGHMLPDVHMQIDLWGGLQATLAGLRIAGRPASEAQAAKDLVVQLQPTLAGSLDMPAAAAAAGGAAHAASPARAAAGFADPRSPPRRALLPAALAGGGTPARSPTVTVPTARPAQRRRL